MAVQDPVVCSVHGVVNCNTCWDRTVTVYHAAEHNTNFSDMHFDSMVATDPLPIATGEWKITAGSNANSNQVFLTGTGTSSPNGLIGDPYGQTFGPPGGWSPQGSQGISFQYPDPNLSNLCVDHKIDESDIRIEGDDVVGYCDHCSCRIIIPRVPGGVSFEQAGTLVGRAMTLEDEDESVGDLLAELSLLEKTVGKELSRYRRVLGMVKIARDIVHNRALKDAKIPIE